MQMEAGCVDEGIAGNGTKSEIQISTDGVLSYFED